jgi:hypothetical protein
MIDFEQSGCSIETLIQPIDKYEIANFAKDDPPRFIELVQHLNPRDAEIMLCYAVLGLGPTKLSKLFGKAGHRAERDLHKAAHKLAGLIAFGHNPEIERLHPILVRNGLDTFAAHSLAACLWSYARSRDFGELSRLIGARGLRCHMMRVFKALHATGEREECLLAGWILWLADGSNPEGKGWRKRCRSGRENKLGPTVFRTATSTRLSTPRHGGPGHPAFVKIKRKLNFLLQGK